MDNIALWKLVSATIFGSSVTTILVEMTKDFVKEWNSAKRNRKSKRDEKRLDIYEEIYSKLNEMSKLSSLNEDIEINIVQLETILREKNLYIEHKIEKITFACCDHFRSVINGEAIRNLNKEQSFLSDFKKEFTK